MKKRYLLIIITGIVVLGISIGYGMFAIKNRLINNNLNNEILSLNKKLITLNQLTTLNYLEKSYVDNDSALDCYKYIGNEQERVIKLIDDIYYDPFRIFGYYNYSKEDDILYICRPQNCNWIDVNFNSYELYDGYNQNEKTITDGTTEFILIKDNNKWKFKYPIYSCERSLW